jgi:Lrp/AsnC family transcriptional regulator for asnA, asnC and gidA
MMEDFNIQFDDLDFAILIHLQKDGRKSFTEIAEELGVSVSTVRNRVTKLIDEKTLQIIGRVDASKVGFNAYAQILISVRPVTVVEQVAAQIAAMDEVSFLAMTTGLHDLEANVMCRNNNHLTEVMTAIQRMEGVFETKTNMYFKVIKIAQPALSLVNNKTQTPDISAKNSFIKS